MKNNRKKTTTIMRTTFECGNCKRPITVCHDCKGTIAIPGDTMWCDQQGRHHCEGCHEKLTNLKVT